MRLPRLPFSCGRAFLLFGRLPMNTQVGSDYDVVRLDNAADWELRAQVQFVFPG